MDDEQQTRRATPRLEVAGAADVGALAALRTEQGWHRNDRLLGAVTAWEHGRITLVREAALAAVGLAEAPGSAAIVAATSAIAAGRVGVIGNVITRTDYRRRGLGRVLMQASLDWLREQGVHSVLLDATVDGRPLYASLGFVAGADSWDAYAPIAALDRPLLRRQAGGLRARLQPAAALPTVAALDAAAFGGDRLGLLALLLLHPDCWLYTVADDASGELLGYLLARHLEGTFVGVRVGPLVAQSAAAAAALLDATLADDAPWRATLVSAAGLGEPHLFAALPGDYPSVLDLYAAIGAHLIRDDRVMRLDFTPGEGATPLAAHPEWLYAWLAPMVF